MSDLFVDKYMPSSIDDMVLSKDIKKYFKGIAESGNLVNMTLAGPAGIGKTSISRLLCEAVKAEVLFIPCGTEGTLDCVRAKITPFCEAVSLDGRLKVVVLDEIDSASSSGDNNFQKSLRSLIEMNSSDTRFIMTANFPEKILKPLKSRCIPISLEFSAKDLLVRIKHILDTEKIEYGKEDLKEFILFAVKYYYPDIRKIINYLQTCCSTGKLVVSSEKCATEERMEFVDDLLKKVNEEKDVLELRRFYIQNADRFSGDYVSLASSVLDRCFQSRLVADPAKILQLSDVVYKMNVVVDKEIQFFALVCALRK